MDLRALLNKLDEVALSEALSLDDIANAVKGKERDEQARAEILNDLAWEHKLPGLYDPISGYFVGKQSVNRGMDGQNRISIAATGSERSDRALADLGLIPDNAKTSTGLGRMFRGDDKGQYDQDLRSRSQGVVSQQKYDKFKTDNLPKLKDLASQLKTAVEKMQTATPGSSSSSSGTFFGLDASKFRRESKIYESLVQEFQDELLDQDIEENIGADMPPEIKKIIDEMNAILARFDEMKDQLKRDSETQRELNAIRPEIANAINAVKAAQEKARADAEKARADAEKKTTTSATPGNQDPTKGPVDYSITKTEPEKKLPADAGKSKEQRIARVKELLAKANQPKQTTKESYNAGETMSELMARIQRIAEGVSDLQEQLTAAEYKELQTYAAGLKTEFGDDPEILQLANRALNLPAVWSSDTASGQTGTDEKKPGEKKPGAGSDPKIKKVQEQLIALGIPLPKFGADGKMGSETSNAIKAFQKLAGVKEDGQITPELEKLLADPNVVTRSKLVQSMSAVEKILAKYKITESISSEDLDLMSEHELRSYVMANIKMLPENEQMAILRQFIIESEEDALLAEAFKLGGDEWTVVSKNPTTGEIILKSKSGFPPESSSTDLIKRFPGEEKRIKDLEANVAKSRRVPVTGEADPRKVQGTGSIKDLSATERDLENIRRRREGLPPLPDAPGTTPGMPAPGDKPSMFRRAADWVSNAFGRKAKAAAGLATAVLAAGGLYAAFSGDNAIEMDPADLAELQKHLKVIDEHGKNPEIIKGLPQDVQDRLSKIIKNLEKLKQAKAKAPATTSSSAAPAQMSTNPSA